MGKSTAAAAPDYSSTAAASEKQAELSYSLGEQQLDWSKEQYNTELPYLKSYLQQQTDSSAAQTEAAGNAQQYYQQVYQPIETNFAGQAMNYNTEGKAAQNSGAAMADVANSYDAQRAASLSSLESYGIDPSQTRYGALDLGSRISQAAATAAAGTQSRLNTESTGLSLENTAINTGRGYSSAVSTGYGSAANSGSSGISSYNTGYGTAANANSTSNNFTNAGTNASNASVNALNTGYNNTLAGETFNANQSSSTSSSIGSAIGTVATVAAIAT